MPEPQVLPSTTPVLVPDSRAAFEASLAAAIAARNTAEALALAPTPPTPPASPGGQGGEGVTPPSSPPAAQPAGSPSSAPPTPLAPPPPVTGAQPVEPDDPDDDTPAVAPARKGQWRELRSSRDEAVARAETLAKKLAAIERGDELPPPLAQLKKEHAELNTLLQQVALERHPRFTAEYESQRKQTLDIVRSVAGDRADEFIGILSMPPSNVRRRMLDDALANATPSQVGVIANAFVQLDTLEARRQAALARSGDIWKEHEQQQRVRAEEAQTARNRVMDDTLDRWRKNGIEVFTERADDAEHNKAVAARIDTARAVYRGDVDPDALARHALWGAAAPALLDTLTATRKELAAAKAEIVKLQGAQPGTGGNTVTTPAGNDPLAGLSGEDRLRVALQGVMPR